MTKLVPMTNLLLSRSTLPFQLPDFAGISDADILPALQAGIDEHDEQITAIIENPALPDFVNTVEALETSGQLLRRVLQVFYALYAADGTESRQNLIAEVSARYSAHSSELLLNTALYERCAAALETTAQALTEEQRRTTQKWLDQFTEAGAHLPEATKKKLKDISAELSAVATEFTQRQLAAQKQAAVLVTYREQLAGLSESQIESLKAAATESGQDGYLIQLELPMIQSLAGSLSHRPLRERLFKASFTRGDSDTHGTDELVLKMVRLRAEKAALLGQPDYAHTVLAQRTAPDAAAVEKLVNDVVPAAMAQARAERDRLAEFARDTDGLEDFAVWDHAYYETKLRAAEYAVDEDETKKYFQLEKVLEDGVFFAAEKLYGITMVPRTDLSGYAPDVRVWEVRDGDGAAIGLFLGDYFTRSTKQGGAWMTSFRDATDLLDELPVVLNVMNIVPAPAGQPTLLSLDEVTTVFHEFGHALHGLLSTVEYPSVSGTSVPQDFVEFPSQFNEMWALWPEVVANFATHVDTGEVLDAATLAKIDQAQKFGQGYATTEYLAAVLIDWAWHRLSADEAAEIPDVAAFEEQVLAQAGIDTSIVPPRYRSNFFKHVFSGPGYAAGYYSYFWSEVLDADAEAWMRTNGGLDRTAGMKYRNEVLAMGDAREPMESYAAFTGRQPSAEHLLRRRGLAA
ncbi:M3 family metallopeptidase [Micrococcoides hystricis]|uniref:M3 family metallopeptidase n=1 Tax=Micrococcoides hystricis TaxID=1572761 RepID=A0ABV6P9Q7_9MICC